jgi:hypothetical protein
MYNVTIDKFKITLIQINNTNSGAIKSRSIKMRSMIICNILKMYLCKPVIRNSILYGAECL